jgi:NitT/TauT family transport system substrate-binding protein
MFAIMGGGEISVIATIYTSNKDYAIIARKDKGISNPRDLEFRKVATSLGTSSEFFMDSFLAINGIARKNVIVVNLKPEELPDALINGDVAAASAFRPFLIYAQKKLGDRGILFYDQDIYTMTFNVVATQEYVRKNPEKVIKMLRALINAEEFVRQNPAEAQKIIADFNLIDRVLLGEMWDAKSYSVKLDQSLVLALEDQSLWAIKSNLTKTKKMPNYLDFIYSDGLKKVKPETVRILK